MGALFSRPGRDAGSLSLGLFAAGNQSSINSSAVAPYLGTNTGTYLGVNASSLPAIPFEWIVSPTHDTLASSCPDASQIATWLAVTEAIITAAALLVGYRPFVHALSRGRLGTRIDRSIWLTWPVPFVCQLTANAIIAGAIVGQTHGYTSLNKLHIFMAYMARPRFAFILLACLRCLVAVPRPRRFAKTAIVNYKTDDGVEFPYTDAWITTALSELMLFLLSAVFTGVTWHRLPSQSKARDFISDHVNYVASIPGVMVLAVLTFVPLHKRYGEAFPLEGRRYETGRHWGAMVSRDGRARLVVKKQKRVTLIKRVACALAGGVILGYICLAQWAYWTRFLQMPGLL
jgi:hypothetical protein